MTLLHHSYSTNGVRPSLPFKGTSLEGEVIEVLTYSEDGKFTVAVDVIGRPCSAKARSKLLSCLQSEELTNIEVVDEDIVSSENGIRVYSTCHESVFQQLSNEGE